MSVPTNRYIFLYSKSEQRFDTLLIQLKQQEQIEALKLRARTNPHRQLVVGEAQFATVEVKMFADGVCKDHSAFFDYITENTARNYIEHA